MESTDELLDRLGLPRPEAIQALDNEIGDAYDSIADCLSEAEDGAIILDSSEFQPNLDYGEYEPEDTARPLILFALSEDMRIDITDAAHNVDYDGELGLNDRQMLELVNSFVSSRIAAAIRPRGLVPSTCLGRVRWQTRGSSGELAAFAMTEEYAIVTAEQHLEEAPPLYRFVIGFADRSRLGRSCARVIGSSLTTLHPVPHLVGGEGFDPFDIAYIGGCAGYYEEGEDWEEYVDTTSPLLQIEEEQLRRVFASANGDLSSLAAYARSLLPTFEEGEEAPEAQPVPQPPVPAPAGEIATRTPSQDYPPTAEVDEGKRSVLARGPSPSPLGRFLRWLRRR